MTKREDEQFAWDLREDITIAVLKRERRRLYWATFRWWILVNLIFLAVFFVYWYYEGRLW